MARPEHTWKKIEAKINLSPEDEQNYTDLNVLSKVIITHLGYFHHEMGKVLTSNRKVQSDIHTKVENLQSSVSVAVTQITQIGLQLQKMMNYIDPQLTTSSLRQGYAIAMAQSFSYFPNEFLSSGIRTVEPEIPCVNETVLKKLRVQGTEMRREIANWVTNDFHSYDHLYHRLLQYCQLNRVEDEISSKLRAVLFVVAACINNVPSSNDIVTQKLCSIMGVTELSQINGNRDIKPTEKAEKILKCFLGNPIAKKDFIIFCERRDLDQGLRLLEGFSSDHIEENEFEEVAPFDAINDLMNQRDGENAPHFEPIPREPINCRPVREDNQVNIAGDPQIGILIVNNQRGGENNSYSSPNTPASVNAQRIRTLPASNHPQRARGLPFLNDDDHEDSLPMEEMSGTRPRVDILQRSSSANSNSSQRNSPNNSNSVQRNSPDNSNSVQRNSPNNSNSVQRNSPDNSNSVQRNSPADSYPMQLTPGSISVFTNDSALENAVVAEKRPRGRGGGRGRGKERRRAK